jgi:sulfonate transport system substrate-binding protein
VTRVVPIDDAVAVDEQKNIDLYTRARLVRRRIEARDLLDPSFNEAIEAGNRGA